MADGVSTYQSGGAGGKYRKKPSRRSSQATPYDRPPTAIKNNNNNNNPSLLAKLVDPASRLLYAGADRLFGVFRKRLNSQPAQRLTEPRNGSQEAILNSASKNSTVVVEPSTNEGGNLASISVAPEISDLENMVKQKTFTRSEIERLTALLHSKATESNVVEADKATFPSASYHVSRSDAFTNGTLIKHVEEREIANFDAAISTPVVNSRAFEDDVASPAELAKAYMGTRPTKLSPITLRSNSHVPRQDLVFLNNTTTFLKTPTTSHTPKTAVATKAYENGSTTFRSRGRSALYNMPRTPYYRGPSTLSQKGVASPSAWEHEGSIGSSRMVAKRRSSALDDIGSGGPMRGIRQKANLPSHQSSLSKLGSSQKLLRNESEPKALKAVEETGEISKRNHNYGSVPTESSQMALKIFEHLDRMSPKEKPSGSKLAGITEKIDSPKRLSSSQDKQKSEGKQRLFSDARESTFQSKVTVEENGSRNVNGSFTAPVSGNTPIVTKAGSTSKRAFSMSAHEDSLELDDDNHFNGHASVSLDENKKLGTSVLANKDVSTRVGQTASPGVDPISVTPEFKKGVVSSDGSVSNTQKADVNFPASTSPVSQPTSTVDTVTVSQNKPTVFPTFGTSTSNSAGPSGVKANASPDARPLGSTSLVDSTMNINQASFSASNKDDNVNSQKSVSLFGASTNSSGIINGTSASSPSVVAFSSVQPSGINTNKIFSSSSSPVISSATTAFSPSTTTTATATLSAVSSSFPTSMSASIFSSGSATASLSSASTAPTSPFASTFATSSNGGSTFGLSSSSATLTTIGLQASTHAASISVTQAAPFKFGSGTSGVPSSASASSLFSSSAPSFGLIPAGTSSEIKPGGSIPTSNPTTNIFGSGFGSSPSFGLNSTVASSETKSASSTNMFGSGSSSTPSFGLNSTIAASSETNVGNPTTNMFGSGFSSTPSFGIGSTVATSDTKSGNSNTNMFGSGFGSASGFGVASAGATSETKSGSSTTTTPFLFGASSTYTPSANSAPFVFGSSNANAAVAPSTGSSVFPFSSNPAPAFGNTTVFGASPSNNNDNMSMEDTMADDTNQTPTPSVPAFGQASSSTPPPFMFGSATPTTPSTVQPPGFMFAAQTNQQPQPQAPSQNPFPAPQFNGGSFSLGSGGDDKSNRRIVKVKRQVRRK
ncbi:uncharacterized protein LOC143551258 isoform X2 [Bidens hawaiensis]|uniref:uncharacterized protein LOC143551258 isoform X2 n=1 Tax=Bidens hawaiensis TaxID=980011 RepID=UPI00404B3081